MAVESECVSAVTCHVIVVIVVVVNDDADVDVVVDGNGAFDDHDYSYLAKKILKLCFNYLSKCFQFFYD